jgi:hypothetical protein
MQFLMALVDICRCRWTKQAIETEFGLLRSTVAIQGATNSVAQYQRQMSRMVSVLIPESALPYLGDSIVKNGRPNISEYDIDGIRIEALDFRNLLERVFKIARDCQHTISPQKMKLGVYIVGIVGIRMFYLGGRRMKTVCLGWQPLLDTTFLFQHLAHFMNDVLVIVIQAFYQKNKSIRGKVRNEELLKTINPDLWEVFLQPRSRWRVSVINQFVTLRVQIPMYF